VFTQQKNQPQYQVMRKLLLGMFLLLFAATTLVAQSGEDAFKAAKKAIDAYNLNNDPAKLTEAVDMAEKAIDDDAVQADPKMMLKLGDIYAAAINTYVINRSTGLSDDRFTDNAAIKGAMAYMASYDASEKKGDQKKALKGLSELQGNITNQGIYAIQDKDFEDAYKAFETSIMAHDFLTERGGESTMTDDKLNDDRYYAGLSAVLLEKYDSAEPMFLALHKAGYDDSGLYDGLYKVYSGKGDLDTAAKYLSEGRAKYPEESGLLFNEINLYIEQGKLNDLIVKLEEGIAAEPDNPSLYIVLGQTFEKLYTKEAEAGNAEKAEEYFQKAQDTYGRGLEQDKDNGKLIYATGLLIYNRGAAMSQELVELGNDFSKEGQRKYEALKTKVDAEFEKALPYFQKAEMSDPNDLSTLIALKEMYARNDEYEISNEFKARIEKVQDGEKIEKSYFKEKGM
jgi:hypothetical protein